MFSDFWVRGSTAGGTAGLANQSLSSQIGFFVGLKSGSVVGTGIFGGSSGFTFFGGDTFIFRLLVWLVVPSTMVAAVFSVSEGAVR